ncbi:MAG: Dam family site-specific DNA-(adenine-N6)-methyltransferase [Desulfobacteraceae bacterium]|nr:Dam family site-specific DNA-(adenine-N6)-methyltransferase [Desulfobacteraceae bacterium]
MNLIKSKESALPSPRPILKWAGGKHQLLTVLLSKTPKNFNQYIEPFFGGGALFFALQPDNAIISESNPELINLYRIVSENVGGLIEKLYEFRTGKEEYYNIRALDFNKLSPPEAAARTIYLNRLCFNGLYRVNRKGMFNVPYGDYKNPRICDPDGLKSVSFALKNTTIIHGDYKDVLREYAQAGDYIYLDPPYLPVSEYSDFKRYTKEQFYEEDHVELAEEVRRLHEIGAYILLTNSNHPAVYELYNGFEIEVVQTRRNINKKGNKRKGEDVVIFIPPLRYFLIRPVPPELSDQVKKYPPTRFMGSKQSLLRHIWNVASQFEFETVLDIFSGSGVVGYMFKSFNKRVVSNDYMTMCAAFANAMIANNTETLDKCEIEFLLSSPVKTDNFVSRTFQYLYFSDEENAFIDQLRANIKKLKNKAKRSIATSALIRACMKKRPRGIFTYTGHRYDDGRKDLQLSLKEHFLKAVKCINQAVFDNSRENKVRCGDAMTIRLKPDLVYIDPPYYSPYSDNEYVRRYHFVEGLACDWKGVEMQWHTKTRKFKSYPTPFNSRTGAHDAFDKLFRKFRDSILIVSYSSNSFPNQEELTNLMAKYKKHVEVVSTDHRYSAGNQGHKISDNKNKVQEYLFAGF